jgi:hypothetical protein
MIGGAASAAQAANGHSSDKELCKHGGWET